MPRPQIPADIKHCSHTAATDQLLVLFPVTPEAASVFRSTLAGLRPSSLDRKSFHHRAAQNRKQRGLHPL